MRLLTILLFIVLSVAALLLPWLIKDTEVETPEQSVTAHLPAIPEVPVQRDRCYRKERRILSLFTAFGGGRKYTNIA
jgi:hypothetical protein